MAEDISDLNIIGIGGLPRSGKDMLAELFIGSGYFGVSLGDIVRNISRTRHAGKPDPISLANNTETSNWLRQTKGPDFALKEALDLFTKASKNNNYKGLLVWSIRAPIEVDFIIEHNGHLIWVESTDEVRHNRANHNLRKGEAVVSLAEFKRQEDEQWVPRPDLPEDIQMNVSYVKNHANMILENNSDNLNEFKNIAQNLIKEIKF